MASAPAVPDYFGLANQQATNSRYNQITPFGTSTWAGNTQINSLSPNQQGILGQQERYSLGAGQLANQGLYSINTSGIDQSSLPAAPINAGQTAQDAIMSRLTPTLDRQREQMRTQLANQGIGQGTEAYENAYSDQNNRENDLYTQAALQGINAGQSARNSAIQNQIAIQNQPLNMVNSLRSGMQLNVPTFSNQGQSADLTGAANAAYNAQMGQYNASTAQNNSMMNGLFGLGAAGLMSYPWG